MAEHRFNGRTGEYVRWTVGLILAGLLSYFTALGTINSEIAAIKATQSNQFGELLRRLDILQQDIRELRTR